MDDILQDERFRHILKDPRFKKIPKNVRKIKVDKRFKNMFKDKDFKGKCRSDERGRPLNLAPSENLKKLYNVVSESSDDEQEKVSDDKSSLSKKPKQKNVSILKYQHDSEVSDEIEDNSNYAQSSKELKSILKKKQKFKNEDSNRMNTKQKMKGLLRITDNIKMEDEFHLGSTSTANSSTKDSSISIKSEKHPFKKSLVKKNTKFNAHSNAFKNLKKSDLETKSQISKIKRLDFDSVDADSGDDDIQQSISQLKKSKSSEESESADSFDEEDEEISNEEDQESDSASESSDSESDDSDKSDEFDHHWEELQKEAPDTEVATRRIAVCNMDWDRIRAEDLFVVFNSFKPPDGVVHSVKIYPSEYGLKRMEEERLKGPAELVEKVLEPNQEDVGQKGSKYHREKLRQYQMNRLRYYYAVVDCDAPETANAVYEHLNGMEYENSSVRFDLRFIPDDLEFDQVPVSSTDKTPEPSDYKPRVFITSALQQVNVNLTWDETDPKRREILQKSFAEPESLDKDIRNYLASSSEESEDANEERDDDGVKMSTKTRIEKYKALLQSLEEKEKDNEEKYDMEITWEPGLKEKTEKIVNEKLQTDSTNPFDEMLKKRKEDRKLKKKDKHLKDNKMDDASSSSESDDSNANAIQDPKNKRDDEKNKNLEELYLISDATDKHGLTQNKSKRKNKNNNQKFNDFKCDVKDPRFSAIYSSHHYNIDPSDPHFKSTDGNLAIIKEKQNRLKNKHYESEFKEASKKFKHS